jgi:hypothetical protein
MYVCTRIPTPPPHTEIQSLLSRYPVVFGGIQASSSGGGGGGGMPGCLAASYTALQMLA